MNKLDYSSSELLKNKQGKKRTVGFEIEYVGVSIIESAKLLQEIFEGEIKVKNKYETLVINTVLGDFNVELDAKMLKNLAEKSRQNQQKNKLNLEGFFEETVVYLLETLIPIEIITPPVDIEQIPLLDKMISLLAKKGAQDTRSSYFAAFGVHINPELPSLSAKTILSYLQSFVLLNDWLRQEIQIDFTRDLSPYINDYSYSYKKKILASTYHPNLSELIDDYLRYNPSRNRALDMLPLFSYLEEEKIKEKIHSNLVKPRPTLHYRLPNTNFSDESWNFTTEWLRWMHVEKLAHDQALRMQMAKEYLKIYDNILPDKQVWLNYLKSYLKNG